MDSYNAVDVYIYAFIIVMFVSCFVCLCPHVFVVTGYAVRLDVCNAPLFSPDIVAIVLAGNHRVFVILYIRNRISKSVNLWHLVTE